MRQIAVNTVLLREDARLPENLPLHYEAFADGWSIVRSGSLPWLDQRMNESGWRCLRIAPKSQTGGVGKSPQRAIARALRLGLQKLGEAPRAATVQRIVLTEYPWFSLVRITLCPCSIQEMPEPSFDDAARQVAVARSFPPRV